MTFLPAIFAGLAAAGVACAQEAPPSPAPAAPWTVPSNAAIHELLAGRIRDNGRRGGRGRHRTHRSCIVSYGRSGARDGRALDGDAIFQMGSLTEVYTALLLADMAVQGEVALEDPAAIRALGRGFHKYGDDLIFNHDGGKAGYRSGMAFNRCTRTGIVILANAHTDDRPIYIALHLRTGSKLDPAPAPPRAAQPPRRQLDRLTGRYQIASGGTLVIVRTGGHLLVDYDGSGNGLEFTPANATEFFCSAGNDEITFDNERRPRDRPTSI